MRKRSLFSGGLLIVAAVLAGSPAANAAPAKHKPARSGSSKKKPTPSKDTPAAGDEDKPSAPPEPEKAAPVADKPPPLADKPSLPEPAAASPAPATKSEAEPPSEASAVPTTANDPPTSASDDEALGRREAARIRAGRIQSAIALGGGVASRHFTYADPIGRALAPYRLPVAPMASFELEAYPAASSDVPILRDLGVRGRLSRGFAFDSNTPQGVTLTTSWTRFGGELRERTLLPGPHAFELGLFAGVDASYFSITSRQAVPALFPAARTVALRFGFDAQLLVAWRLSLMLGGAYLATTSVGEIYDRFRKPKVGGVDADFGAAIDVAPGFQARLTGRYTRYFASFKPTIGDRYVAGGALDEQMQFGLGVRYAH